MNTRNYNILRDLSPDGVPIPGTGGIPAQPEPTLPPDAIIGSDATAQQPPVQPTVKNEPPTHEVGKPVDIKDDDATSIDDFMAVTRSTDQQVKKEVEPPKKEEEGKDKVTEPIKKEEAVKKETTPPQKPNPNARDYSGIDEGDVELFKNMNNAAFAKLKPIYMASKNHANELKQREDEIAKLKQGGLPDSYFEHPEAYQFDPEYQQTNQTIGLINSLTNHWRQQMELIESGKDWQDVSWDESKKQFVLSNALPASPQNRIAVLTKYQQCLQQQSAFSQKLEGLKNTFVQRHQELMSSFKTTEDNWFPQFKDEKTQEYAFANELYSKLPASVQKNPLSRILSKALATSILLGRRMTEMQKAMPANSNGGQPKQPQVKVQPTVGQLGGGSAAPVNGNEEEVSMDDFIRLKKGY